MFLLGVLFGVLIGVGGTIAVFYWVVGMDDDD